LEKVVLADRVVDERHDVLDTRVGLIFVPSQLIVFNELAAVWALRLDRAVQIDMLLLLKLTDDFAAAKRTNHGPHLADRVHMSLNLVQFQLRANTLVGALEHGEAVRFFDVGVQWRHLFCFRVTGHALSSVIIFLKTFFTNGVITARALNWIQR